jgi:adenylate cyclase
LGYNIYDIQHNIVAYLFHLKILNILLKDQIYKNYVNDISDLLKLSKRTGQLNEIDINRAWNDDTKNKLNFESLQKIRPEVDISDKYQQKLGSHPDFKDIRDSNKVEYHSIISMFIDIKGSTNLFKTYSPFVVASISKIVQLAAIHTCWLFDGYIHRLHGDGLMVYFGGKSIKNYAEIVYSALSASAYLSHFMMYDINDLFEKQGIKKIYIRTGIDLGYKEATLWHLAGLANSNEVTTCSLHSSLAAKMQGQASSNGVIIGGNIFEIAKLEDKDLFDHKPYEIDGAKNENIYEIPEDSLYYKQYTFDWTRFLSKYHKEQSARNIGVISNNSNLINEYKEIKDFKPYFTK